MQRKKTFDSFRRCKVAILSVLMSLCMTAAFAQSGAVKGSSRWTIVKLKQHVKLCLNS